MSEYFQDPFEATSEEEPKLRLEDFEDAYVLASKGQRFVNYLIDRVVSYILFFVILVPMVVVFEEAGSDEALVVVLVYGTLFVAFLGYFILLEKTLGKTLGKMVSRTRVVREDGSPITWGQAIGRTFARMIPFEAFSVLFSDKGIGWHDSLAGTRVVQD